MQQMPDIQELLRLAQTPSGRKLIALLKEQSALQLQEAAASAAAGNYDSAKTIISGLLSSPEAQKLLKEMEDNQ